MLFYLNGTDKTIILDHARIDVVKEDAGSDLVTIYVGGQTFIIHKDHVYKKLLRTMSGGL